jgi:uncharacterized protein
VVIEIRPSSRGGRGLFASEDIPDDVMLMEAPLLMVPAEQRDSLKETVVDEYVYEWDGEGTAALVLGVSSMCNHDPSPNAHLWLIPDTETAELWSIAPIAAGEEITVSYRMPGDDEPLWFEVTDG